MQMINRLKTSQENNKNIELEFMTRDVFLMLVAKEALTNETARLNLRNYVKASKR
jgi:hypothetical protein